MAAEDRIREAFEQLASTLRQEFEVRASVLARELSAAIDEDRMAAEAESLSRLASELAAARAEADLRLAEASERAANEARERAIAEARAEGTAELERLRAEVERLRSEVERLGAEAERARAELEAARVSAHESGAELAAARAAGEESIAELTATRASVEATRAELAMERASVGALRAEADRERRQAEAVAAESQQALERATAAEQALQAALDRAAVAEQALQQSRGVEVVERQGRMAELDRLAAGVGRIGRAGALTDVLSALADAAAPETARTAVLVASGAAGDAFQVFRSNGFSTAPPGSILRDAVKDLSRGLPFAPLPGDRVGYSVPIEIGGQTVALLYGDDGDGASGEPHLVPSAWPEAMEILARHATLRLETLTALRTVQALSGRGGSTANAPVATMGAAGFTAPGAATSTESDQSARRYARLLVSEIKLYNESAVRLGREAGDLLERLGAEIERARRVYEERVPVTVSSRATYFDDEIVQILADGDPGLLGRSSP